MSHDKRRWSDRTRTQKIRTGLGGAVQLALLVAALADIRRRPAAEIKGGKRLWTALSFVSFVGPIAYFTIGHKGPSAETPEHPAAEGIEP
jgi:hypothetical protein